MSLKDLIAQDAENIFFDVEEFAYAGIYQKTDSTTLSVKFTLKPIKYGQMVKDQAIQDEVELFIQLEFLPTFREKITQDDGTVWTLKDFDKINESTKQIDVLGVPTTVPLYLLRIRATKNVNKTGFGMEKPYVNRH